ncbi:MAG: hypothetical protein GY740_12925, partial [Gammaproteobacteria bacterium]|nr:hypothetical protein [Gammaproteobacteria bacterium]
MPPFLLSWDPARFMYYPFKFEIGGGHYATCNPDLVENWSPTVENEEINMKDFNADLASGNLAQNIPIRSRMERDMFEQHGARDPPRLLIAQIDQWNSKMTAQQRAAWQDYRTNMRNFEIECYCYCHYLGSADYQRATDNQQHERQGFVRRA